LSLESLIEDSGQQADITAESNPGVTPPLTTMGGVNRSTWLEVVTGVPCLVDPKGGTLNLARNDARANVKTPRIYFTQDPVPLGLNTKHRITVSGGSDPTARGVYAVQDVANPNSMGRIFQVDCERIRVP
jgi:hypothetical protein